MVESASLSSRMSGNPSMYMMSLQYRMSMFSRKAQDSWKDTTIGLVTAGDDSPGMNAAVRAVVRMGMYLGCTITYIKHGLKGLVEGGHHFELATWSSTSDIISEGGTALKSFKCPEFLTRPARVKAAKNLVEHGINNLVAIGGDGTLKAMKLLHDEWTILIKELEKIAETKPEKLRKCNTLKIVCLLASIVNDVAGTDASIGCDSALHRIIEATDAIATTASSSQLAFVIEVMGKQSGYLALCSGIVADACMVFIPEWPPEGDWKEELFIKVQDNLLMGCEGILVIVSEGATDRQGRSITAQDIQAVLTDRLNLNAKITVLGHVQRGGAPSAYDRLLATRFGAEGLLALRDLPPDIGTLVMTVMGSEITCLSLNQCLEKTSKLEKALQDHNFVEAVRLRGRHFQFLLSAYTFVHGLKSSPVRDLMCQIPDTVRVGVIRVGKSTLGHCLVARAIVGYFESKGICLLGISEGFEGLVAQSYVYLCWDKVKHWSIKTVACLGSSYLTATEVGMEKIAAAIDALRLSGLVIVGGFPAYESLFQIHEAKAAYRQLCIPMCVVPVTVLNNVPGSELSIGCDTSLNEIVTYCDKLKTVARGRNNCVFIVETWGNNCGYLTSVGALCVGADAAYVREEYFNLDVLLKDVDHLRDKIQNFKANIGIVLRCDTANDNYDTDFIHKLFSEEGKGVFHCRSNKIGQVQMGSVPSPKDRVRSSVAGIRCGEWMTHVIADSTRVDGSVYTEDPAAMCVLCFSKRTITFKPISRLLCETDFELKVPTFMWWLKLRSLMRVLAEHYENEYEMEAEEASEVDPEEFNETNITRLTESRTQARPADVL